MHYNFYREGINPGGDIAPKSEQIGEDEVFTDFIAELDHEDVVTFIHKLKCSEIVETKTARYWAERVE